MENLKANSSSYRRLYRQAKEFTDAFWETYNSGGDKFSSFFTKRGEVIELNSLQELQEYRNEIRDDLEAKCKSVDAQYAIPLFVNLMTSYYYSDGVGRSFKPIVAAKIAITFIWRNTYEKSLASEKSFKKLVEVLTISEYFVLIEQLIIIWEFEDLGKLTIYDNGNINNAKYFDLAPQIEKQGRHEYKVIKEAMTQIWEEPNILDKLSLIITHSVPKGLTLFGNSFLSDIPFSNTKFWYSLWSKIYIYETAIRERVKVMGEEFVGMSLIPQRIITVKSAEKREEKDFQTAVFDNFWQPEWYRSRINLSYYILQGMIVERPILRIDQSKNTFVTSILLLHDSVNMMLEDFVHSNEGSHIYEKHFSQPFELETIDLFRSYGFLAGEVTTNGAWRLQEPKQLKGAFNMPGQIDLLVVNHVEKLILIADCKMLHFPYEKNKLNNLRSKFTFQDSEGFYKKIEKKAEWISTCVEIPSDYMIITILITNRHIILPDDNHRTFSIEELRRLLEHSVKMKSWIR